MSEVSGESRLEGWVHLDVSREIGRIAHASARGPGRFGRSRFLFVAFFYFIFLFSFSYFCSLFFIFLKTKSSRNNGVNHLWLYVVMQVSPHSNTDNHNDNTT